ncbi:MAG: cytochrome c biogenesis protein CcdA, partial [Candidatus Limnocylindrales bacterium]
GALLLAIFGLGMAAPLFVLALLWERLGANGRSRLRGREVQVGPVRRHISVVVSSVLFIVLGLAFIAFQGGNALGALYDAFGAGDLALQVESWIRRLATDAPLILLLLVAVPASLVVVLAMRGRRRADPPEETA